MPNTPDNFEYIYDFMILNESSYTENGYTVFDFEKTNYTTENNTHYCLRNALRNLGYKIIKKKYNWDDSVTYYTNVPEDIHDFWMRIYNENNYSEEPDSESDNDNNSPEDDNDNQNN